MKELHDRELLQTYLERYQIENVFNEQLKPHLSLYHFGEGEIIGRQGEPAEMLYLLVKGKMKIYTISAEGNALVLTFKTPLNVVGDIEYVMGNDLINTVEAVSSVHMIGIPYRWLSKYAKDDPAVLTFLLEIVTRKFYIKVNNLNFILTHPVEVRLASYLLSVSYDESDTLINGKLSTISLVDAANLIGTSYRHLNRVLHKFCALGLVERSRGYIQIMDREGLSEMACHNIYENS